MSKISDAADSVKQFAAQHQAIFDVAVVLGEIGSIEQAAEEAKAARTKAVGELAEVKAELAKAQDELAKAKADAEKIVAASNDASRATIEQARYAAEDIVKTAKADADNLRDVAAKDAEDTRVKAEVLLAAIEQQIVEARGVLSDLKDKTETAKTTLTGAEAALAAVRDSAQKILG